MSAATDFAINDEVIVIRFGATDSMRIGRLGRVVGFDRDYVEVIMNDDILNEAILFLPSEIEKYVEPEDDTATEVDDAYRGIAENYAVRLRELGDGEMLGDCFEYFYKPTGQVLLTTQFVSLDTLGRIAEDHKEGRR